MRTLSETPGILYGEGGINIELIGLAVGITIAVVVGVWKWVRDR